jgi:hypothetical protein
MIYAMAGLALGDTTSAIDGFSIASAGISQRSAAWSALATICLNQGDYPKALNYADKSLDFNQLSSVALQTKILALRKLRREKEAGIELAKMEERDPLNHFIRIEKYLSVPSAENRSNVQKHITCELPHETYLEYALWYYRNGQLNEALKILEIAPQDQPVVLVWEAYLNHQTGHLKSASELLVKALKSNPEHVFPFRTETLRPLEWAGSATDNWKVKYYTGLIYLNAGAEEKGLNLWKSCENQPDFFPFYLSRSRHFNAESEQAKADIEKALTLAADDWRAGLVASKFYLERGDRSKAENLAATFYAENPQNYYLGLHYAKMLEMNRKYQSCINLLEKIKVLPNEGATESRVVWRNANIGNALELIKSKKYRKAVESISRSKEWPSNLGVGKPYLVDERMEDFIALYCYQKLHDEQSEADCMVAITGSAALENLSSDANDFLTAWLLRENGNKTKGDQTMKNLGDKNPESKIIQWCNAVYSGNQERAKSLFKEAGSNDQTSLLMERIVDELLRMGSYCCQP